MNWDVNFVNEKVDEPTVMARMEIVESFLKEKMLIDPTGHDYYHATRVRHVAELLSKSEGQCDLVVIACAALLHDVPDPKVCDDIPESIVQIRQKLAAACLTPEQIDHVMLIISTLSYKGANVPTEMSTLEGKIVQDADRLDALGAIGIARCFAFGGSRGRPIFDPSESLTLHNNEKDYRQSQSSSLGHFNEKLLLLKDKIQTKSGKKVAEERHKYLQNFYNEFIAEWNEEDAERILSSN